MDTIDDRFYDARIFLFHVTYGFDILSSNLGNLRRHARSPQRQFISNHEYLMTSSKFRYHFHDSL